MARAFVVRYAMAMLRGPPTHVLLIAYATLVLPLALRADPSTKPASPTTHAATTAPDADPALVARISVLLEQLDAADYRARERATIAIEQLPPAALPFIEQAVADGDLSPEVRARLAERMSVLIRKVGSTKYEQRLAAMIVWERDASLAAYDHGGHTNPKWDDAAHEALVLNAHPRRDIQISYKDQARIVAAIKHAIDLGCDDPFVRYAYAQRQIAAMRPGADARSVAAEGRKAADGVLAGNYAPWFKILAAYARITEALAYHRPPELKREVVSADIDTIFSLIGPAIRDGTPQHLLMGVLIPMQDYVAGVEHGNRLAGHRRMMKALEEQAKGTTIPAYMDAEFYIRRGYGLREDRNLNEEQRAQLLAECAAKCEVAVEAGLAPDPEDTDALNRMIRYLCLIRAPADEFERWFDKAMRLYPNDFRACQMKHPYLRENGTREERLAFGRACAAQGNWPSRIPLIICEVHVSLGDDPHDPEVWWDISSVDEAYLARFPDAHADRTSYLRTACLAEHWDIARAQFEALGDNLIWRYFDSPQQVEQFRKRAAQSSD